MDRKPISDLIIASVAQAHDVGLVYPDRATSTTSQRRAGSPMRCRSYGT
jgi:predicted nucleic acid-binding protein